MREKVKMYRSLLLAIIAVVGLIVFSIQYPKIRERKQQIAQEQRAKKQRNKELREQKKVFEQGITYHGNTILLPCDYNRLYDLIQPVQSNPGEGSWILKDKQKVSLMFSDDGKTIVSGIYTTSSEIHFSGISVGMEDIEIEAKLGKPDDISDGVWVYTKDKKHGVEVKPSFSIYFDNKGMVSALSCIKD